MSDIGTNLAGISYWSTEFAFLDRFKTSVQEGWTAWSKDGVAVHPETDAYGNPLAMPAGVSSIQALVQMDPVDLPTTDRYVLTYEGEGTIVLPYTDIVSQSDGQIVFDFKGHEGYDLVDYLSVTLTSIDASNPIHDIHIVRADQVDLYNAGEIFNPAFIDDVKSWGALRFMDWGGTNGSQVVHWSDRAQVADASYSNADGGKGVPIEVMVALANEAHTDMWYDIPAHADDDYVRQAVHYIKDHLDPSLKLHLEYSNEVWNWAFEQATYARDQAQALFGSDSNYLQYYGYRSAQVAAIANGIYGAEAGTRLANVLSTQTAGLGSEAEVFKGVALAKEGSVSDLFDSWAITGYFGNDLSMAAWSPDAAAIVVGWAKSGAAGLDAAFKELASGGSVVKDSVAHQAEVYAYWEGVAHKYGLTLDAYEAGAHLVSQGFGTNQQLVEDFFARLINDPRMAALYTQNVNAFTQAGGDLFNQFNDVGTSGKYGYWGTTDSTYSDPSAREQAYLAAREAYLAGADTPPPADNSSSVDPVVPVQPVEQDQTLAGTSGADTLIGGIGNDTLDGGSGADRLIGGAGDDLYFIDNSGDSVLEYADQGTDEIRTTLNAYGLGGNVENLSFIGTGNFTGNGNDLANVITGGAGNDTLFGGAGNDLLQGGAGNDELNGGTGADTLIGGAGDDFYYVDNISDVVTEDANGGYDTVRASVDFTLGANIEALSLEPGNAHSGTGNDLDNNIADYTDASWTVSLYGLGGNDRISGSNAANYIDGGTGDDFLQGGGGNDTLIGGGGNDWMSGGDGDDVLIGGAGADTMTGGAGADRFVFQAGDSTPGAPDIIVGFSHAEGDKIDLTDLGALTFIGSSAFSGHAGELRAYEGQVMADLNGDGIADFHLLVSSATALAASDFTLAAAVTDPVVTDPPPVDPTPADPVPTDPTPVDPTPPVTVDPVTHPMDLSGTSAADTLIGGSGNDRFWAGAGNDLLQGGAGNDELDGGVGADTLIGGTGDDYYFVDNIGDVVTEDANGGYDTVRSSVDYTLGANIEALSLEPGNAHSGTGNDLDNNIADYTDASWTVSLYGLGGNDRISGSNAANYIDGGTGDDFLQGGGGNDTLIGGDGNDWMSGGDGDDVLIGGAGADTMTGGAGADRFVFQAGDSTPGAPDIIVGFSHAEGDKIDLSGIDAISGTKANDSFHFIGSSAFSGQAGELRVHDGQVMADFNGDRIADFHLLVNSTTALVASDFVL